jgi:hypothetical protein
MRKDKMLQSIKRRHDLRANWFKAVIPGIFLLGAVAAQTVNATPVYITNLNNLDKTGNQNGTNTSSGSTIAEFIEPLRLGISSFGTAEASGTGVILTGRTTTNSGLTIAPGGFSSGRINFGDFILSDGSGGAEFADVSVNFFRTARIRIDSVHGVDPFIIAKLEMRTRLRSLGSHSESSDLVITSGTSTFQDLSFTSATTSIALNTPFKLEFEHGIEFLSGNDTNASFSSIFGLTGTPFNLPDGVTVQSIDASIINNSLLGSSPDNPFMPVGVNDGGGFEFDAPVSADDPVFIDPVVATGYDYEIGDGDPNFASVTLPDFGDGFYDLVLFDNLGDLIDTGIELTAGDAFDFTTELFADFGIDSEGISKFGVRGIEVAAGLDPNDPAAFVTGLTFVGDGQFTGTMTPILETQTAGDTGETGGNGATVPEPSTLALFGIGCVGFGAMRRRRKAA